jgi:hypothetical protein
MVLLFYNALNGAPAKRGVRGSSGSTGGEEGVTKKNP